MQRTSRFTVDYLINKDSNDFMLDMTFGEFNYHEWNGAGTQNGDVAEIGRCLIDTATGMPAEMEEEVQVNRKSDTIISNYTLK